MSPNTAHPRKFYKLLLLILVVDIKVSKYLYSNEFRLKYYPHHATSSIPIKYW